MTETHTLPKRFARAFKAADIRGVYPEEINETVTYRTARAFVEEGKYKKIVVGYDMRTSTPALAQAFVDGARASGADVVDIGMVRSPMLYFASGELNLPGAVITASHSPAEYNGIKLVHAGAVPYTAESGLDTIKERVKAGVFTDAPRKGKRSTKSLRRAFRSYILKGVDRKALTDITVVSDIGNGMSGVSMAALDELLPARFPLLFAEPDGTFPNRGSDPTLRKNQKVLAAEIVRQKADFGVGFDGDGDRIAFLDEKGRYVNCAVIGALIAKRLIAEEPGAGIVYTNLTSRVFAETITAAGGKAHRARVGHTFLKEKMRKTGAVFGAEHSGHFFWRDFFNTDSTVLTLLAVLEIYSEAKRAGKTFSELVQPYQQYQQTEDTVIEVADKKVALALIEKQLQKMKPKKVTKFDGFFVDFGEVWGAIKPSVTEYAIKLMFEAKKKSEAVKIQKELTQYVRSIEDKAK